MHSVTQAESQSAHGLRTLGFSIRFVSANLRVFFILPMSAWSCQLLCSRIGWNIYISVSSSESILRVQVTGLVGRVKPRSLHWESAQ